jgi:hypothetical protein
VPSVVSVDVVVDVVVAVAVLGAVVGFGFVGAAVVTVVVVVLGFAVFGFVVVGVGADVVVLVVVAAPFLTVTFVLDIFDCYSLLYYALIVNRLYLFDWVEISFFLKSIKNDFSIYLSRKL